MKKRFALVVVLAMVMSFIFSATAAAEDQFTVHVQAPSGWGAPGLWAWSDPDLTNVFSGWPGQQMTADENNPGWYYFSIPTWANCIILNNMGAGNQTANLPVDAKELWVTVADDNSANVVYDAPAGFVTAGSDAIVQDTAATTATADTTATTPASTDLPKTGVADYSYLFMSLAGLSGAGFIALKRKKNA